ncbi:MAG: 23S rRNA pseudouridine(2605) synthase RluB, partial [Thiothrix sp.]
MKERIQKILARAGYGSRREIERWIISGDILVNGRPATIGQAIDADDRVTLRGRCLYLKPRLRSTPKVLIYNKPAGEVCTRHDPEGRKTVFAALPRISTGRWVMVGRLDINTDGLLLFTTDGALANKLMHPSSGIEREYACRILGEVDSDMLQRLQSGVALDDGKANFLSIRDAGGEGANHWYHVVLAEGRNREVRRLWESQGVKVSRLIRVRYGTVELPRSLRT